MGLSEVESWIISSWKEFKTFSKTNARAWLWSSILIKLSYVDGAFEIEEECLLKEIARSFDISDNDFLLLDNCADCRT